MNLPNHAETNATPSETDAEPSPPINDAASPVVPASASARRPRSFSRFKRRVMVSGFVAAVIAAAALLQGLFNGFGLGTGDGGGPGSGQGRESNEEKTTNASATKTAEKTVPKDTVPNKSVVEIRLDGDSFYRRLPGGGNGPSELSVAEIVAAATRTEPDRVRVRVYQRFNANLTKWDELKTALMKAGLKRTELEPIDEDR